MLFGKNATIVRDLVKGIAENCPKAFILVISNPVNSTVPIAAEVMKQAKSLDPKRLFGVTTLDVVRAETFVQGITGEKGPAKTVIPVIGGHSGNTIVPLFSLAKPAVKIPQEKLAPLIKRMSSTMIAMQAMLTFWAGVQFGGDEVVNAKGGAGSATLSMAYAGFRFDSSPCLVHDVVLIFRIDSPRGLSRPPKARRALLSLRSSTSQVSKGVMQSPKRPASTTSPSLSSSAYVPLLFCMKIKAKLYQPSGAEKAINILGDVSSDEKQLLEACRTGLKTDIKKGTDFIQTSPPK